MVSPKGDKTDSMFIASGAPTQRAVTNTDSGGKNGRIASQSRGNNLRKSLYKTGSFKREYFIIKIYFGPSVSPVQKQA